MHTPHLARRQWLGRCMASGAWLATGMWGGPRLAAAATAYRDIGWMALMPRGWDPTLGLKTLPAELDSLQDTDPRAREALARLRAAWDNAPVVAALAGTDVRLPGYVVPLEASDQGLREFLLVPYFGACIHSPPPPSNQIVMCRAEPGHKGLRAMDAVWVSGRLQVERSASDMGAVGYAMRVVRIDRQA